LRRLHEYLHGLFVQDLHVSACFHTRQLELCASPRPLAHPSRTLHIPPTHPPTPSRALTHTLHTPYTHPTHTLHTRYTHPTHTLHTPCTSLTGMPRCSPSCYCPF
jgi:hypothetical protein